MVIKASFPVLVVMLLVRLSCSARSVDDEPQPDIEGLCRGHCERVLECGLSENAEFDDMDGCMDACRGIERWEPSCTDVTAAMFECQIQFDCPEYGEARAEQCEPELLAFGNCRPGE